MKDFDKVYKKYDDFMNLFSLYKLEEIKNSLNLKGHEIVLDVGGGTGKLANFLSDKCETIYILDESEGMLSKVEKNKNIITILGDALNMDFKDSSMDIVVLTDVIHHITDQEKLIDNIHRVLKNKGKLLILDFEKNDFKTKILSSFEKILFRNLNFRSKNEVIEMMNKKFIIQNEVDKGFYFIIVGEKND